MHIYFKPIKCFANNAVFFGVLYFAKAENVKSVV
jgi:hypothetical protein